MRKRDDDYEPYMDNLARKISKLLHGERLDDTAYALAASLAYVMNQMPWSQLEQVAPQVTELMNSIAARRPTHEEDDKEEAVLQ